MLVGKRSSLPRVSASSSRRIVAGSQAQQSHALAVEARAGGLHPDPEDELVEAKLTPVFPRKTAVLVQGGGNDQSSRTEQNDGYEEDEYMYVSVTGKTVNSKQAELIQGEERRQEQSGKRVAFSLLRGRYRNCAYERSVVAVCLLPA